MSEFVNVGLPLLVIMSVALSFTRLWKLKVFHFAIGEIAFAAAVAYAFQADFIFSALWFLVGSLSFVRAAWLVTR